jgi:hypothetical protein
VTAPCCRRWKSIPAHRSATPPASAAKDAYVALPLWFEPNVGQADERATFLSRGHGRTMLLTRTGAVIKLGKPAAPDRRPPGQLMSKPDEQAVIELTFEGANPDPVVAGRGRLEGVSNYLLGSDPDRWFTGLPNYSRVFYRDLYDGVSLAYYASRAGELEFDLTLAPGGSGEDASVGAGSWLDGRGKWFIPGATDSADFPVTPGAFQATNAGAFDAFLVKVDLDTRYKGSGQRAGSVTVESSGSREGLTRDRVDRHAG